MVYGETYTWDGDTLNIYTKFVENIVNGAEEARTKEIVDHFRCDLSDFREFLEAKQKQQPMIARADKLRKMSTEQMAKIFANGCRGRDCPTALIKDLYEQTLHADHPIVCEKCWLEFLREEVPE